MTGKRGSPRPPGNRKKVRQLGVGERGREHVVDAALAEVDDGQGAGSGRQQDDRQRGVVGGAASPDGVDQLVGAVVGEVQVEQDRGDLAVGEVSAGDRRRQSDDGRVAVDGEVVDEERPGGGLAERDEHRRAAGHARHQDPPDRAGPPRWRADPRPIARACSCDPRKGSARRREALGAAPS